MIRTPFFSCAVLACSALLITGCHKSAQETASPGNAAPLSRREPATAARRWYAEGRPADDWPGDRRWLESVGL